MVIEEKLIALWGASGTATALVPAYNVKVPGNWQNLERPYIIIYQIAERPIHTHGALQPLRQWTIQFSILADSYSSANAIAEAMRGSIFVGNIDGVNFSYRGRVFSSRDDRLGVEHIAVEYLISETLGA